jgi:ubiquitin C-terminal hydrolase
MDFILFDPSKVLEPFGLINAGASCYLNSIVQALISCTSVNEVLAHDMPDPQGKIARSFARISVIDASDLPADQKRSVVAGMGKEIWSNLLEYASSRKEVVRLDAGQQCAGEGFHLILQAMEDVSEFQRLFQHRYKTTITCSKCLHVTRTAELYSMFEVQPDLKVEQLEDFKDVDDQYNQAVPLTQFLRKQNGYVEDYKCPKCNDTSPKFSEVKLTMVGEILVVHAKKYQGRRLRKTRDVTPFPKTLTFDTHGGQLVYEAVAQVEHMGSLSGGHYLTIARRKDGWNTLDDNRVSPGEFKPTANTSIVFYHITATCSGGAPHTR